jgi:hypothetical protein
VADIVRSFGRLTGDSEAVVSVSLLRRTLCSKLHVDHVPLRVGLRIYCSPHHSMTYKSRTKGSECVG